MKVYRDNIFKVEEYIIDDSEDLFEAIVKIRNNDEFDKYDANRFFLEYLPQEKLQDYDFSNPSSLDKFRKLCLTYNSPLLLMGGCNMRKKDLESDIRNAGIKMSDPFGKIYGSFDIRDKTMTYSPIFPHFYEERDLIKFARDSYFTTMTFEEIMMQRIDKLSKFYVHVGNYKTSKEIMKYGRYILEKINKKQMREFVSNPSEGEKIFSKYIKY